MSILLAILAFTPIISSAIAILVFRKSALTSALIGIFIATILIILPTPFTMNWEGIQTVVTTALILTLSVALVIIPGLYFNGILSAQGIIDSLTVRVASLPLEKEQKALLLLLGVLPTIEALTGFGVSLFLGIPIFFRLFPPPYAYRLSLLGMNIMPWGTLALATIIGASLADTSIQALGTMTALTSTLIFPTIGVIAVFIMSPKAQLWQNGVTEIILGLVLSLSLYGFNRIGWVETAGITAGITTTVLGGSVLFWRKRVITSEPSPNDLPLFRVLLPYTLVLSLLTITRGIPPLASWLSQSWVISNNQVNLSPLSSPGMPLAVGIVLLMFLQPVSLEHQTIGKRAGMGIIALFGFIFLSQLMSESDMIATIATALREWEDQPYLLLATSPLLGMVSGFITGSNVSGNALLMSVQTEMGTVLGEPLLFSAVQNSATGYAVFTSLPIIVLTKLIAQDQISLKDHKTETIEQDLLRFGLKVAFWFYLALVLTAIILLNLPISLLISV